MVVANETLSASIELSSVVQRKLNYYSIHRPKLKSSRNYYYRCLRYIFHMIGIIKVSLVFFFNRFYLRQNEILLAIMRFARRSIFLSH